jgi:hypothetical protein
MLAVVARFYDKDKVSTNDGFLNITTTSEDMKFFSQDGGKAPKASSKLVKHYKSGMVQGWNK